MKTKYIIVLVYVTAVCMCTSGCKKFLKEVDPSNLAPATYFTTPDQAE